MGFCCCKLAHTRAPTHTQTRIPCILWCIFIFINFLYFNFFSLLLKVGLVWFLDLFFPSSFSSFPHYFLSSISLCLLSFSSSISFFLLSSTTLSTRGPCSPRGKPSPYVRTPPTDGSDQGLYEHNHLDLGSGGSPPPWRWGSGTRRTCATDQQGRRCDSVCEQTGSTCYL